LEHIYDDGLGISRAGERSAENTVRLDDIHDPSDLRALSVAQLEDLAVQIRAFLVEVAASKGGHFAPSLGTVELTLALHHVYDTPRDRLVWDVGHQAYAHKILTGRRAALTTIRQYGGLSGFLKRTESRYDAFGAGHASTAPSAALGMATARDLLGESRKVVAVIGDGAMTGGLAFEALNNAGATGRDLLVVLNDNAMSISPNVGAVAHYLTTLTTHPHYRRMKGDIYRVLERLPSYGVSMAEFARRLERGIKGALVPGALFQAMGFHYLGPIDGHDLEELVPVLSKIRATNSVGPILLHVLTQKGKGYAPAEADPLKWHGVKPFDPETGKSLPAASAAVVASPTPSFTDAFGAAVVAAAERRPEVVAITAAMPSGTGLATFRQRFPERFYDVGIAEGHGVTFAAGLAAEGLRPVCAIYSTFLQRAFDHIVHDVAIQDLPVVFAVDRAGVVGADGPTHHGCFDLAYLRLVPGMVVSAARDADQLADLLETGLGHDGPFAVRYPRDASPTPASRAPRALPIGSWEVLHEGSWDVALVGVGTMVGIAEDAAERLRAAGLDPAVVDARFVKPLDLDMLRTLDRRCGLVVTIEEGCLPGGFGSAVVEACLAEGLELPSRLMTLGLPDRFIAHGSRTRLLADVGLTGEAVAEAVLSRRGRSAPANG
jgi:1-deoxy-D-xylulose-5-phosphate synthase